jgi:thiol-disulfide isomerase/thioredoxin
MRIRPAYLMCLFQALSMNSISQNLNKGGTLPDIEFANVFNYNKPSLTLSEFSGKLVLLDFWSTGCGSCIQSFSKIDSLQIEFKNRIQIVLVNKETKDSVIRFFTRRKKIKVPQVPFITGDTILEKLFPHDGKPFYVWIDKNKKVEYMTDGYYVSHKYITEYLESNNAKVEEYSKSEYLESLVDKRWENMLGYYSYIARPQQKFHLETSKKIPGHIRITFGRASISKLYQKAYEGLMNNKNGFSRPGHTVIETNEPNLYIVPEESGSYYTWAQNNTYSYQLMIPEKRKTDLYKIMLDDLNRYFDIEANVEKRLVKFLSLERTSEVDKLKTRGGKSINNLYTYDFRIIHDDTIRYLQNRPFNELVGKISSLTESKLKIPFIDDSGYKGNIDIVMSGNVIDNCNLENLQHDLQKYDLCLKEKWIEREVLVLKNKNGTASK